VFDPQRSQVTFASAGHLQPILLSGNEPRFIETEQGLPLGLGPGKYSEVSVSLPPGSRFVLYSDGITEATSPDGEEYGQARLQAHLHASDGSPESLLESVRGFANGAGLSDDASVVMIRANSN